MKDLKLSIEISRELASSVLGLNVVYTESCEHRDGIIGIWTDINTKPIEEISIYEFAFKCKEWAYTNKYRLSSGQHRLNTKQEHYINNQIASYFCSVYYITNDDSDIQIDANTEPEAIFKACEWLLENSK